MEDVLEVYARPYDPKRPVVCVDESSKELRSTPRGSLLIAPAEPEHPGKPHKVAARPKLSAPVETAEKPSTPKSAKVAVSMANATVAKK